MGGMGLRKASARDRACALRGRPLLCAALLLPALLALSPAPLAAAEGLTPLREIGAGSLEALKDLSSGSLEAAKGAASESRDAVGSIAAQPLETVKEITAGSLEAVRGIASGSLETVRDIAGGTLRSVRDALSLTPEEPLAVVVEGISGEALRNVREAVALPEGLLQDGKVDRQWLDRFHGQLAQRVRAAMEPYGHYRSRIVSVLEEKDEERFVLRLVVEPGEPVRLKAVEVSLQGEGAQEPALGRLAAAFPLAPGQVLVQPRYEEAKGELLAQAQELGYLDADFLLHEIRISRDLAEARIGLILETGRKYAFGRARIEGAPGYPEPFLRRYLSFAPGEPFSQARLGETQLNLMNSERFREVNVVPEREGNGGTEVPVLVQLAPGPSRSLRQGIGYGTDTGGRFSLRYRDLNVLDRGHEFQSNLYLSERLQGLSAGYILPDAVDIRSSTALQANLQRLEVSAYTSRILALEVDRNRSLGRNQLATAYFKLQWEGYTVGSQESSARLVVPGLRYSGNFYDNATRPTRGFRCAFDLRGTHQVLGADLGLLQVLAEGSHILPLPWRLSLSTRLRGGLSLLGDPLSDLPPSLRFFAGGDQSVRGYAYQSLGPRDALGQVAGGKHLVSGSVELEKALFEDWGVSLFYDAGNAFDSFRDVRLAQGAGVGLHYYTQVGALNLSLARQIGEEAPGFRIHFTVGFEL